MAFVLTCSDLTKAFGERVIFQDLSFQLEEHEKLGILGSNGSGKSTLLKTIVGELPPDQGTVTVASGKRLGYLAQYQEEDSEGKILDLVLLERQDLLDMETELSGMEKKMAETSGDSLNRLVEQYRSRSEEFEALGGLVFRSEAEGVLKGLGFTEEDFGKSFSELSGGQKTRVSLARLLVRRPDILLLDEPINHLDLSSVEWLENYLMNYKGAVILVAHDRYFLNRIIDHALDISMHPARLFKGDFTSYREQKRTLLLSLERQYEKQEKEIAHQKEVIRKLQSFNREKSIKRAESRKKVLDRMEVMDRPEEEESGMSLSFHPKRRSGNDVLTVTGLTKSFDGITLFENLDFSIQRLERVALLGDNGTGKTTILKIINQRIPADRGQVRIGANVDIGYYDQEQQNLTEENTLFDELQNAYPEMDNTRIRSILARFHFRGEDVFKRISNLSGGERARVSLAKLMLSEANFLILDEPTNHLDIESKEILEDALKSFDGTLFYVSHDRYFINQTAERILVLSDSGLREYLGNYDDYMRKKEEQEAADASASGPSSENKSVLDYNEQKRKKAERKKIERSLEQTEKKIEKAEARVSEIDDLFQEEEVARNSHRLNELNEERSGLKKELEELYSQWEEISLHLEEAEGSSGD